MLQALIITWHRVLDSTYLSLSLLIMVINLHLDFKHQLTNTPNSSLPRDVENVWTSTLTHSRTGRLTNMKWSSTSWVMGTDPVIRWAHHWKPRLSWTLLKTNMLAILHPHGMAWLQIGHFCCSGGPFPWPRCQSISWGQWHSLQILSYISPTPCRSEHANILLLGDTAPIQLSHWLRP